MKLTMNILYLQSCTKVISDYKIFCGLTSFGVYALVQSQHGLKGSVFSSHNIVMKIDHTFDNY